MEMVREVHDSNSMVIMNPNLPANKDVLNQFGHCAYMVFEMKSII